MWLLCDLCVHFCYVWLRLYCAYLFNQLNWLNNERCLFAVQFQNVHARINEYKKNESSKWRICYVQYLLESLGCVPFRQVNITFVSNFAHLPTQLVLYKSIFSVLIKVFLHSCDKTMFQLNQNCSGHFF